MKCSATLFEWCMIIDTGIAIAWRFNKHDEVVVGSMGCSLDVFRFAIRVVAGAENRKPNVIVIMADDLGYGDLSCYGTKSFSTPNIDRLAAEGRRFTSGYCSASTCTPTRFSFLTGVCAFRQKGTGVAPPNSPMVVDPSTFTIADAMKQAGYHTAVIGKWHLGLGRNPTVPIGMAFCDQDQENWGSTTTCSFPPRTTEFPRSTLRMTAYSISILAIRYGWEQTA